MKRLYFICNLHSGKAAISNYLGKIINRFTESNYEVIVHPTQYSGDGIESAKYACQNDFDLIVCSGGDGTLNEVIQGCMLSSNKIPIGYIPNGSTNDFARGIGIPISPMEAIENILNGKPLFCDVGSFNEKYFTYIAAFGAFTEISYQTPQQYKNVLGHAAYILSGIARLPHIKSTRMRIEYDNIVLEDNYLYGMITNSTSVANLLSLSDVEWDDGLFEVTLIKKPTNLLHFQKIISSLANGLQLESEKQYIDYFRASNIKVTNLEDDDVAWTIDGEYGGNKRINKIKNHHKAISFLMDMDA